MARTRIRTGILEYSTNADKLRMTREYIIEVVYTEELNKLSHAYNLIGIKHKKHARKH